MHKLKRLLLVSIGLLLSFTVILCGHAVAISAEEPLKSSNPDLTISAFGGNNSLDFVELFNQSNYPIQLKDYTIQFTIQDINKTCADQIFDISYHGDGYILSGNYFSILSVTPNPLAPQNGFFEIDDPWPSECGSPKLSSITISTMGSTLQNIELPITSVDYAFTHKQRTNSSLTRNILNSLIDDYKAVTPDKKSGLYTIKCQTTDLDNQITLCSSPLYLPPLSTAGLQIVEVLPRSQKCSPTDTTSTNCFDYVKLFNSSNTPIDLSSYRLRLGYLGQNSTSSNTRYFNETIAPNSYLPVFSENNGNVLSITDSGGFVWLEDTTGITKYDGSVTEYPNASSDKYIGTAYASNGSGWSWTTTPNPFGENILTTFIEKTPTVTVVAEPKSCRDDQYLNTETNRCNSIVTTSTLVECLPTQYRNPDTNGCKNIETASASLTPCAPNQTRNPETNRCKAIEATSTETKSCDPGWTRNPETNRCRKDSAILGDSTVKDVETPSNKSNTEWLIVAGVIVVVIAYAIYEWRHEIIKHAKTIRTKAQK